MISGDEIFTPTWLTAFKAGDRNAFNLFYVHTLPIVLGFIRHKFSVPSGLTTEDIAAEAYYRVFKKRETYLDFEHVSRSLLLIAANFVRSLQYKNRVSEKYQTDIAYIGFSSDEYDFDKEEKLASIKAAIEELPRMQRIVLTELIYNDKTTGEIADMLKLSRPTVLNHRSVGINNVIQKLGKQKGKRSVIYISRRGQ